MDSKAGVERHREYIERERERERESELVHSSKAGGRVTQRK